MIELQPQRSLIQFGVTIINRRLRKVSELVLKVAPRRGAECHRRTRVVQMLGFMTPKSTVKWSARAEFSNEVALIKSFPIKSEEFIVYPKSAVMAQTSERRARILR